MTGSAIDAAKPKLFKNSNTSTTQHDLIHLFMFEEQNQRDVVKFALNLDSDPAAEEADFTILKI
jgi:hypothetical protein